MESWKIIDTFAFDPSFAHFLPDNFKDVLAYMYQDCSDYATTMAAEDLLIGADLRETKHADGELFRLLKTARTQELNASIYLNLSRRMQRIESALLTTEHGEITRFAQRFDPMVSEQWKWVTILTMLISLYEEAVNSGDYNGLAQKIWKKNASVKCVAVCSASKYVIERPNLKTIGVRADHQDDYYEMCGVFANPDLAQPPANAGRNDEEYFLLTKSIRNNQLGSSDANTKRGPDDVKESLGTALEMAYESLKAQGWASSTYKVLNFGFEFTPELYTEVHGEMPDGLDADALGSAASSPKPAAAEIADGPAPAGPR